MVLSASHIHIQNPDETRPLKEGEQCKSTWTKCIEGGSCAIGQKCSASCSSGQRIKPCEWPGLKCIDDPTDSNKGFCRKAGKTFRIINECKYTPQFCVNEYVTCNN